MEKSSLAALESIVRSGKTVMTAEDSIILAAVQDATRTGRTATFYVNLRVFKAWSCWYWTPRLVKDSGLEPVSAEEKERIRTELGLEGIDVAYSNRIECQCGGVYGAFEFMQEGVQEHGKEAVQAVFDLQEMAVIRVNPVQDTTCPNCRASLLGKHWYEHKKYGCSRSEAK
ncbi:hypothetical protein [Streptomyces sp. NPDC048603]|uniref:hypothetical protein n=1 Tax=Streptomyces sp. NPDC048603 TaxID=3365577 RepID=UPI00371454F5